MSAAPRRAAADLGDFLAEAGAVVGGAAALGAVVGFVSGSFLHDFRPEVDPDVWARRGGCYGGLAGLVVVLHQG
jgi:hypothetical protein